MDPLLVCIVVTLDAMHTERHSGATELCKETQIEVALLLSLLCSAMRSFNIVYFTVLTTSK